MNSPELTPEVEARLRQAAKILATGAIRAAANSKRDASKSIDASADSTTDKA